MALFLYEKNYPEWLNSLRGFKGESPLLSIADWEFLVEIRSQILEKARKEPDYAYKNENVLHNRLSRMKNNFKEVVECLRKNPQPRNRFLQRYEDWRYVRQINVEELLKIAKNVEEIGKKFMIGRLVGSSASLLGGALSLVVEDKEKQDFFDLLRVFGTATSEGLSRFENDVLLPKVQKAEKIIKDDKEYSEWLWSWLSDATYLEKALESVKHCDVDANFALIADGLKTLIDKKRPKSLLEKEITALLKSPSLRIPKHLAEEFADVIGILTAASMISDHCRPMLNLAFKYGKFSRQFYNCIRVATRAMCLAKDERRNSRDKRTTVDYVRLCSGMALDGIDIVRLIDGLKSEHEIAKWIKEAAGELQDELDSFERVNREISQ